MTDMRGRVAFMTVSTHGRMAYVRAWHMSTCVAWCSGVARVDRGGMD